MHLDDEQSSRENSAQQSLLRVSAPCTEAMEGIWQ